MIVTTSVSVQWHFSPQSSPLVQSSPESRYYTYPISNSVQSRMKISISNENFNLEWKDADLEQKSPISNKKFPSQINSLLLRICLSRTKSTPSWIAGRISNKSQISRTKSPHLERRSHSSRTKSTRSWIAATARTVNHQCRMWEKSLEWIVASSRM